MCEKTPKTKHTLPHPGSPKNIRTAPPQNYLHSTTNKINQLNFNHFSAHQKKISQHYLIHSKVLFKEKDLCQLPQRQSFSPISSNLLPTLNKIEKIVKDSHQLTLSFGYFYITAAMVQINEDDDSVHCWIHPLKKSNRPLHPIKNKTQQEAQKQFYIHLKLLIRDLYPLVPLPPGNSYFDLIFHFNKIKKGIQQKVERKNSFAKLTETKETLARVKSEEIIIRQKQKTLNQLMRIKPPKLQRASCKFMSSLNEQRIQEHENKSSEYANNAQKNCVEYQKNTMSTLLGSIKSNASIKEKIGKVPYFEREYEGKKSVIVENKKEEEGSQDFEEDFDELFSSSEKGDEGEIREEVARQFQDLLFN